MSLPIPKLDDKTFAELFAEARALIPRYAPDWTDHNLSDPGITFVDLFAWLSEMQIYSLDQVTDHHYQKFLRLLGLALRTSLPARADLTFSIRSRLLLTNGMNSQQSGGNFILVPQGAQVTALDRVSNQAFIFETDEDLNVVDLDLTQVLVYDLQTWSDNSEANRQNSVFYYAFGETAVPQSMLYLGFNSVSGITPYMFPTAQIKLRVDLYENDLPPAQPLPAGLESLLVPSTWIDWTYWNGRTWHSLEVEDTTHALLHSGQLSFYGPPDIVPANLRDAVTNLKLDTPPRYWIRAELGAVPGAKRSGYEISPRMDTIVLNTVSATQHRTVQNELHDGNGLPGLEIELQHHPVVPGSLILEVLEEPEWQVWLEVPDLDASLPEDRHYQLDAEPGRIIFGDGINGKIPPAGQANIRMVRYRAGGGEGGNLQAQTITTITHPKIPELAVENRRAASGGTNAETMEAARRRVPRELKRRARLVTSEDYVTLVSATPLLRIARVEVLPLYHPQYPGIKMPGTVTVVVVPFLPEGSKRLPEPSDGFLQTVYNHLRERRLVTTRLQVYGPHFTGVTVSASLSMDPRLRPATLEAAVRKALEDFLDPLNGGSDGKGWPFGRPVYRSEIIQVIRNVPGVVCVNGVTLSAGPCIEGEEQIDIPRIGLVYPAKIDISINPEG
ncbi:MAG: putative baseplate assembly protein [Calditrichaeota bacterium]|nr:putative baseplate assembly protein [Calditrichota bacterium]